MSLDRDYFARMYAENEDPWGFRTRWYERRKRDLMLASLTRPRYRNAFEPGCSVGALTGALAGRCDRLLAVDLDESAVENARRAMSEAELNNVEVRRLSVPQEWPVGTFDLVVVSEIGYYLSSGDLDLLMDRIVRSLEPGGTLVACHWRHPVADYPQSGDAVHARIRARTDLVMQVAHDEADFLLHVLTRGDTQSPASLEGLTT